MKKYFLSIVALAGMLFATSCQESIVEPQVDGTTTFTIEVPGQMGTKAQGETYKLYVEVYKDNGTDLLDRIDNLTIESGESTSVKLNLVATQKYDVVFWAQKDGAYVVENLTEVGMNEKHHNSEGGAAYYAIINDYEPSKNNNPSVVLTRPFAQLNLFTIDEVSYENENSSNKVTIISSEIKVESVAGTFQRVNTQEKPELGEGVNETTFTYSGGDPLTSTKTVGTGSDAKTYQQVSMDYMAVVGNKDVVKVTATIVVEDPNGVRSTIIRVIENVPLQMNYRTNIIGNLITSESDFTVTIDEGWLDDDDVDKEVIFREVATAADLQQAIAEGVDNITLVADITTDKPFEFKAPQTKSSTSEQEFVLDLNGKTINAGWKVENTRHHYAIDNYANLTIKGNGAINARGIQNFGTMTIEDGVKITAIDSDAGAAVWNDNGVLVINGGEFTTTEITEGQVSPTVKSGPAAMYNIGGNVTINGGKFTSYALYCYAILNYNNGQLTINSAIVNGCHGAVAASSSASTIIYDGTFDQDGPKGQSDHCIYYASKIYGGKYRIENPSDAGGELFYHKDKPSPIAEGYTTVVGVDGWTYVVPGENFDALVNNADQLADAVAAGKTNILLADGEYDVRKCGGKTLILTGMSKSAVLKVYNEGEDGCDYGFGDPGAGVGDVIFNGLTINTTSNTGNYKGYAYMKGTFNNCDFIGAYSLNNFNDFDFNNCTFDFQNGYFWTWGAESVTFDGCTFNGNSKNILAHGWSSTVINIKNCTFAATAQGFTGTGDNTACVEIDPAGNNTYTINFCGENTKTEFYAGWTRIKDNSTGHKITGLN